MWAMDTPIAASALLPGSSVHLETFDVHSWPYLRICDWLFIVRRPPCFPSVIIILVNY